jgi:3-oxoadipate enol-lactonase
MKYRTHDGYDLFYEVYNVESKLTPIVFLNGLSQSTVAWILCLPYFKERPVILLDFIFQGQSDKHAEKVRNFDEHALDVFNLINHLNYTRIHLAGISYGSLVAQNFALNHSGYLDKLILISSFAHKTPFYEAIELSWHRALEFGGYPLMLDVMLPFVLSENYFSNPLIPIDLMKQGRADLNNDPEALRKLMVATRERPDFRTLLNKINNPTLVIHGEMDLLFPVHMGEMVSKCIPDSNFLVINKFGHTLNLEAPLKLAEAINNHLK